MRISWTNLAESLDRIAPEGTPGRKLIVILAVILLVEGLSVIILFTKVGVAVGLFSLVIGILLLLLLYPARKEEKIDETAQRRPSGGIEVPLGIRFVDFVMGRIGNSYLISSIGCTLIVLVLVWNLRFSARPEIGDMDTLTILFGGLLAIYPYLSRKFKVEAAFSLIFLGFVVLFLVVPQAVISVSSGAGSGLGNWYVHYMLAAPFAGALNLLGIEASSQGSMVVMEFQDGTIQALGISAYCAGLYSFSIFVSAFIAFVLVFERLPLNLTAAVLGLGLLAAYLGNLFRMVVIGVVGYYRGIEALLWAHENAGWVIFLGWSAVFWYLVMRFADRRRTRLSSARATDAD